ncbi:LADA_0D08152g1_1 [Lachancea dasiensis]|uniref:LADA_0D08152g1_1 n=1 Tax=Lachancea dasiensis TaxID=1072105 RepID=A0A1G4J6R0_9SACH|nr:LADA_0D08152g1_1 [Lachancea dasiensis]
MAGGHCRNRTPEEEILIHIVHISPEYTRLSLINTSEMQFSTVVSLAAVYGAVAMAQTTADAISQIGDGQIQATSAAASSAAASSAAATSSAPAESSAAAVSQISDGQLQATSSASLSVATSTSGNATISYQTENGAANMGSGAAAMAGLVAAGAMLI